MRHLRQFLRQALLPGLVCASAGSLAAIDLPLPLSRDEVACDRAQLERLALRMMVQEVDPANPEALNPSLFLWRMPGGGAAFSGLGVTDGVRENRQGRIRDERQLSAVLSFANTGDRLDPKGPLLPFATLARRRQDSNLVNGAREPWLTIWMEAAPQVIDPSLAKVPLVINSLDSGGGSVQPLAAADAVGRGLLADELTRACHPKLTDFDERVFRILSRTVRLTMWFTDHGPSPNDPRTWNVVLYRGEDPHLYRATVFGYQKTCNNDGTCPLRRIPPSELEMEIQWDEQGRLTTGAVRLLPQLNSSIVAIFLLPPIRPGRDRQGEADFAGRPFLRFDYLGAPTNILTAVVNWEDLLANSNWNE